MAVAMIDDTFDALRGRFMRMRRNRPLVEIHADLDVHPNTIQRLHGGDPSPIVMHKIVRWCAREEAKQGGAHGHTP